MKNKRINLSVFAVVWLLPVLLWTSVAQVFKMEKGSVRRFPARHLRNVAVDNDYGRVEVRTTDADVIKIIYTVHIEADDAATARKAITRIRPFFRKAADTALRIETRVKRDEEWERLKSGVQQFYIDYTLILPKQTALDLRADYGTLEVKKMEARLSCEMDYGHIRIGELHHSGNIIRGDYIDSLQIGFMRGGRIESDYTSGRIGLVFHLEGDGDYNRLEIDHAKNLHWRGDHNILEIQRVKNLILRGDYQRVRIRQIFNADFRGDGNKVVIHRLAHGPYRIHLDDEYGNYRILNENDVPFRLNLRGDFLLDYGRKIYLIVNKVNKERKTMGYYLKEDAPLLIHGYLRHSRIQLMPNAPSGGEND